MTCCSTLELRYEGGVLGQATRQISQRSRCLALPAGLTSPRSGVVVAGWFLQFVSRLDTVPSRFSFVVQRSQCADEAAGT